MPLSPYSASIGVVDSCHMYTCVIDVNHFCSSIELGSSDLARGVRAKGHARATPEHGTLQLAIVSRLAREGKKRFQRFGTGAPCHAARPCQTC